MKKRTYSLKKLVILAMLIVPLTLVMCTKKGQNAEQLDRSFALSQLDNTLFSPFYDTVKIPVTDNTPDVNDVINTKGVMSFITNTCASADCHGGKIKPTLANYADVKNLVVPGNPDGSKLWQLLTTNDLNKAMPPVNKLHEPTYSEKNMIYNWIANGAKEFPDVNDYQLAAVNIISTGCASANCHNTATAVGYWARNGHVPVSAGDTVTFPLANQTTGAITYYPIMKNTALLNSVWNAYKDSVKKFYSDTVANASFRVFKTFTGRGPLVTYDDILMDIKYPKSIRSAANSYWVNGVRVNSRGDYLNASSSMISRIDSTIVLANPRTGVFAANHQADMAWADGGFGKNDIAIVKAWYFLDPNIPDVWKYGINNTGIFKYRKSGFIIKK